jgi:hypothetical protein
MYNVYDPQGKLLFTTPDGGMLRVILKIPPETIDRIMHECAQPLGQCSLYANNGPLFCGFLSQVIVTVDVPKHRPRPEGA